MAEVQTQAPGLPAEGVPAASDTPAPDAWLAGASEQYRSDPAFTKYTSFDGMLAGTKELAKHLADTGRVIPESPAMPHAEMAPEDRTAFFAGLDGAPPDADAYTRQSLDVPEGVVDPTFMRSILDAAAGVGIQGWQLDAVLDAYQGGLLGQIEAQTATSNTAINDAMAALDAKWHGATERNVLIADEYIRRRFGEDAPFLETLITRKDGVAVPLKNVPEFIEMAHELGLGNGADRFIPTAANGQPLGQSQAQAQIDAARAGHAKGELTAAQVNSTIERYGPAAHAGRA